MPNLNMSIQTILKHKRCHIEEEPFSSEGPPHMPLFTYTVKILNLQNQCIRKVIETGTSKKNAKKNANNTILNILNDIPDPCIRKIDISNIKLNKPIITFREPEDNWFDEPQILGIDFEGLPPALVQIGCRNGIVIENLYEPWVQHVLHDQRHIHYIFGEHENDLVGNPFDIQGYLINKFPIYKHPWSLVDGLSLMYNPFTRYTKDKSIHEYTDWAQIANDRIINDNAKDYAAIDAYITYKLAILIHREQVQTHT